MIVAIAATTRCRRGEILKLEWTDIDFEACVAILRASTTKTNRSRSVSLDPVIIGELRKRHALRNSDEKLVFPSEIFWASVQF